MAKAPSLREDRSKGTQRTRKLSTVNAPWMLEKCEGTLQGVAPWRRTAGVERGAVQVARRVLNGGCDMKSSQSLLCSTLCPDTTRCPISGILRRCAGRQRPVQRLRTMNPQSPDWHRTREGPMYLSASRRRRGEDGWYGEPR